MLSIPLFATLLSGLSVGAVEADIIHRDVCVIGGGSSGTHAAIQMQLKGKSVAVIERDPQLGGHVDTYKDPKTGKTTDYGVVVFNNVSAVRDYFQHWNIPLTPSVSSGGESRAVNFRTGKAVSNPAPLSGPQVTDALNRYRAQLLKYPGIKEEWNIPQPVPEDFLISFGDFVKKYNLEAMAPLAYSYNQGAGNVLAQPALYIMKYFERQQLDSTLNGFLYNKLGNNQLIYDKAKAELGKNAFVNSQPSHIERHPNYVDVHFTSPSGSRTIRAKKLLISIEPNLQSLHFLDMDANEQSIFRQFNNSFYYDAIVQNTGIHDNTSLSNSDAAAPLKIPGMPGLYGVSSNGIAGTHNAYYGSAHYMSDDAVRKEILAEIARARAGLGYPAPRGKTEIIRFNAHVPFVATVSTTAVKNGFYKKLQALQGQKNTFYTGAAWNVQASSNLWGFNNDVVLPKIMRSLGQYKE